MLLPICGDRSCVVVDKVIYVQLTDTVLACRADTDVLISAQRHAEDKVYKLRTC